VEFVFSTFIQKINYRSISFRKTIFFRSPRSYLFLSLPSSFYGYTDMPADLIDASVERGAKGILIAGVGNGNMPKAAPFCIRLSVYFIILWYLRACLAAFLKKADWPESLSQLNQVIPLEYHCQKKVINIKH
jgi:hypothetical protein